MVKSRLFFHSVSLFLTIVLSITPILGKGFCADTLVKTVAGYQPIEHIRPGERVVCYDTHEEHAAAGMVQAVVQKKVNEVIWIDVRGTWIKAACDQQFYTTDGWCRADALLMGDCLVCDGACHLVESVLHVQAEQPCMVYDLSIPPYHTFHVSEHDIVAHNVAIVFPLGAALLETKTLCSIGIFIGCCFFQYKTGIKVEGEIDATRGGTSNSSASRSQASPAISSSAGSSNFDNDGSYSGGGLESQAVRVRAVEAEKTEDSFSPPTGTYDHETELIERSRNPTASKGCHTGPRSQSFYVPDDSADSQGQVCNDMSGDSSDEVGSSNKNGGDKNEKCICGHKCLTSKCQCTCSCPCGVKNLEKRKANKPKKRDRKNNKRNNNQKFLMQRRHRRLSLQKKL